MLLAESGGSTKGALSRSLGGEADRFIDTRVLAKSVKKTSGHQPLGEERRERVQRTLKTLRQFLSRAKKLPLAFVFAPGEALAKLSLDGVEFLRNADPCLAAMGRFDQLMEEWEAGLRAARLAELEIEGVYDPQRHARSLARFDWQAAAAADIEAAPAVVAVETLERIAEAELTSLGRLLRSGRPLYALALRDADAAVTPGEGVFDLPYLAMAHREALVVAESLAAPAKVAAALERVSRSLRPAVAVIAVVGGDADHDARLARLRALHGARITPSLIYDPDEGEGWAERFTLRDNESVEAVWPAAAPEASSNGDLPLTPADAAALIPARRGDFWTLPAEAWSDEQVALNAYLDSYDDLPPATVPYILVAGDEDVPARAVITRELANFCHEAARAWRGYQELAGVHNQYVDRAVDETRRVLGAEQDEIRERLVQTSRQEGAAAAVYRLVEVLSRPNGLAAARASVAAAASAAPVPAAAEAAAVAAPAAPAGEPVPAPATEAPEPEAPPEPTGPYIDTVLCTSCNDCINLNPQMFKYNEEKQAYIADPNAGTYKQLLKAAAACPAKCIHPGPPPN